MRKLLITYLLSFCISAAVAADVRDYFVTMPDSVLPLLSSINRLDMLDFHDSGMKAVVRNRLDGESELVDMRPRSMKIRYTGNTDVDIRLFYYKDSVPMICLVRTVGSNGLYDSRIDFYDSKWHRLDASRIIQLPSLDNFIRSGLCKDSVAYVKRVSSMGSMKADMPEGSETIEFKYTGLQFMGGDSVQCASCLRKDPVICDWNGKRFILRKNQR